MNLVNVQFWKPLPDSSCPDWLVCLMYHHQSVVCDLGEPPTFGRVEELEYWFEMSTNALAPNGVNMYAGEAGDVDRSWISGSMDVEENIKNVPGDIVRAALLRIVNG